MRTNYYNAMLYYNLTFLTITKVCTTLKTYLLINIAQTIVLTSIAGEGPSGSTVGMSLTDREVDGTVRFGLEQGRWEVDGA